MRILLLSIIIIFFLNISVVTSSNRQWDSKDTSLLIIRVIDLGQTLNIKKHPGYYEMNPLLGRHPNDLQIYNYFIGLLILDQLNNKFSPNWLHNIWENVQIYFENCCITNNTKIGLEVKFFN